MVLPDSHQMFVSCATRDPARVRSAFDYRAFTVSGCTFQYFHLASRITLYSPTTPTEIASCGLASFAFARRYLQNHFLVFFS